MWLAYFILFYLLLLSLFFYSNSEGKGKYIGYGVYRRNKDNAFLILSFLFLTFLACFRGPCIGTDTINYVELYDEVRGDMSIASSLRFEPGFILYVKLLCYLSDSPQILIATSSLFIMFSFYSFIKKYSNCVWLSVFVFFCLFFNASLNIMRQYIAISILLFAFESLLKKEKRKFFFLLLLAFLFHYPSFVFAIAYPMCNSKINKRILIAFGLSLPFIIVASMALSKLIFSYLYGLGIFNYYSEDNKYIEGGVKTASWLLLLFYIILIELPIKAWRIMKNNSVINSSEINKLSFIFGLLSILLLASSLSFNLIDRFVHFFSVYLCVLLPNALNELSKRMNTRFISVVLVLLLSTYYVVISTMRPEWTNVYPYEFY